MKRALRSVREIIGLIMILSGMLAIAIGGVYLRFTYPDNDRNAIVFDFLAVSGCAFGVVSNRPFPRKGVNMIELIGVDAFLHNLAEYQTIRDEEYAAAAQEAMDFLRSPLREYAPERAAQTYVRTYIFQEGWDDAQMEYQASPDGFIAMMGNPVMYGPYVQGDPDEVPHQAAAFVDRWKPTSDILKDNESEVVDRFDAATERIVDRLGTI